MGSNTLIVKMKKPFFELLIFLSINSKPPSDAVRQQKKNFLEDLFSSVLSQFKKYHVLETQNLIIKAFSKA